MEGSGECCFICLDQHAPLIRPCACPSLWCHQTCLARWQLQSAGREEESKCRFCKQSLPSWKAAFSDPFQAGEAMPVMSIQFNGATYWLEVKPGDGGVEQFKEDVRRLLGLAPEQSFDITFECHIPGADPDESKMELQGLHAYDAAVYCASLTAARRFSRSGDDWRSGDQPEGTMWSRSSCTGSTSGRAARSSTSSTCDSVSNGLLDAESAAAECLVSGAGHARRASSSSSAGTPIHAGRRMAAGSSGGALESALAIHDDSGGPSSSGRLCLMQAAAHRILGSLKMLWEPPEDLMEFW